MIILDPFLLTTHISKNGWRETQSKTSFGKNYEFLISNSFCVLMFIQISIYEKAKKLFYRCLHSFVIIEAKRFWFLDDEYDLVWEREEINSIEMQQNKHKKWSKHIDCILDAPLYSPLFYMDPIRLQYLCLFVNCKQFSGFVNNTKFSLWKDNWQVIESSTIIVDMCEERNIGFVLFLWGDDDIWNGWKILEIEIFYARWCSFIMKIHTHENKQNDEDEHQHFPTSTEKWW